MRWFGNHRRRNAKSSINLFDRLTSFLSTRRNQNNKLIRRLLQYGANPNADIPKYGSVLEALLKGESDSSLNFLLKHGLNFDIWNHHYLARILRLAKASGSSRLAQELLKKCIDPDLGYKYTRSEAEPLVWGALLERRLKAAHFAIMGGADVHTKQEGWSLLGYTAKHRMVDLIPPLVSAGANVLEKSGP